jgi:hypothetical protein
VEHRAGVDDGEGRLDRIGRSQVDLVLGWVASTDGRECTRNVGADLSDELVATNVS